MDQIIAEPGASYSADGQRSVRNPLWEPGLTRTDECRINPALVAAMYAEHADELRHFLLGVLRNADAASDVAQISFAKAMEAGHLAREETLKGWLFRVAFHEALAYKRRKAIDEKATRQLASGNLKVSETPDERAVRKEALSSLRTALESLPIEQRTVVRMKVYDEKTFAKIADELGLPLGTVLTRMQLALRKLRNALDLKD